MGRKYYRLYYKRTDLEKCPNCVDFTQGPVMERGGYIRARTAKEREKQFVWTPQDVFCTTCFPGEYEWFTDLCSRWQGVYVYVVRESGTQLDYPDTILLLLRYARDKYPGLQPEPEER